MNRLMSIDIEAYDPNLLELGNGAIRKDGSIICVSTYDGKNARTYFPGEEQELEDQLKDPNITWIAHNGIYDYDWLQNGCNIPIAGRMEDTMTRESLINEYSGHYDLDSCCLREGIQGKNATDTIEQWWKDHGGQGNVMKNLMLVPRDIVAKYNNQDAIATYNLYQAQQPKLKAMGLLEINGLECRQLPIILEMRKNGIRIDVSRVDYLREQTTREIELAMAQLSEQYGLQSLSARKGPGSLSYVLTQLGVIDNMLITPTGELSIAHDSLVRCPHPIAPIVIDLRRKQTLLDKYLNSAFVKFLVGDRLHGTFKPTQRDDGGTITGRYACSDPNLQNFSAREQKGGDLVRGCFLPDEGMWLAKLDYAQIEYRLLAHYAVGPGSTALRESMKAGADYHKIVQDMLGWHGKDGRKLTKNFNFGMIYGMGLNKFKKLYETEAREAAAAIGMTTDQYFSHYYNEYFRRMTYVKPTMMAIEALSKKDGSIRSIGGRMHRFPLDGSGYKMTNYLIQGSAADINKKGLADAWDAGVFNTLKLHLTVHDETVASSPKTKEGIEAIRELKYHMCNCIQIKVPIDVDPGVGKNWYHAGAESNKGTKIGSRNYQLLCNRFNIGGKLNA